MARGRPGALGSKCVATPDKIDPSRFKEKNLRMVQRLVKVWRMEMAGLIILDGGWMKSWPLSPSAATDGERDHVGPIAFGNIPR